MSTYPTLSAPLILTLATMLGCFAATAAPSTTIVSPADTPAMVKLAAKEVRRYVYLRTGKLLPVQETGKGITFMVDPDFAAQQYRLKSDRDTLVISGGFGIHHRPPRQPAR